METNELYKKLRHLITKNIYFSQIKNKEDRETIINNSFINIWARINNGELSKEWDEIKGYCFISLKNNTLEHLRKVKKMNSNIQYMDEINTDIEDVEEYIETGLIDKVKRLIQNPMVLNEIQSKIMLEKLNGLTYKEIGELYDLTTEEIRNYVRTAIYRLRNQLGLNSGYKTTLHRDKLYVITNVNTNKTTTYTSKEVMAKENGLTRRELEKLIKNGTYNHYSLLLKNK